jgi:predicted hotdog family 3-hydroxylacyl-ACP dehydratase
MTIFPVSDLDILNYIPQRNPFVLVDSLIECSYERAVSMFTVPKGHLMTESGRLCAEGICENIAQTGALLSGYTSQKEGHKAPVGFIVAIKGLKIETLPAYGNILRTEVKHQSIIGSIIVMHGKVWSQDRIIAEAEMKILLQTTT